jgi:hypothetical protein
VRSAPRGADGKTADDRDREARRAIQRQERRVVIALAGRLAIVVAAIALVVLDVLTK